MTILKTNLLSLILPVMALLALPVAVNAEILTGIIKGHTCTHADTHCPVDRLDPHITLELDFVLVVGDKHYFMPNLSRDVKLRHVLENVQVVGKVDPKYRVIDVEELRAKKGTRYVRVWSVEEQLGERCKDQHFIKVVGCRDGIG